MKSFKISFKIAFIFVVSLLFSKPSTACTGIKLTAKDGSNIIARTMEWGGFQMPSQLILVPRGYTKYAVMPNGMKGMKYTAKYGYVGIGVLEHNFVAEAVNEKGLCVELFYFPNYGESEEFDPSKKNISISDAEMLGWIVGRFATVDELLRELNTVYMTAYGEGFDAPHFSVMDATGKEVVLEYYDHKWHVHNNTVGVITNAPNFDWMVTNLNNYVNVFASTNKPRKITSDLSLRAFGVGSAAWGLPGDLTPPSRFVRAAFYVHTASPQSTGRDAVMQSFQILNNFDLPIGAEFDQEERNKIPDMLSATQWTTSIDTKSMKFYYRTQWNYSIRCIDLKKINFTNCKYQAIPLDIVKEHPVEEVHFR